MDTIGVWALAGTAATTAEMRMRDLCAGIGDLEEPASGTTTAARAFALTDTGLQTPQSPHLDMTMGVEMGRPSTLSVTIDFDADGRAVVARLRGRSRQVLAGHLAPPRDVDEPPGYRTIA